MKKLEKREKLYKNEYIKVFGIEKCELEEGRLFNRKCLTKEDIEYYCLPQDVEYYSILNKEFIVQFIDNKNNKYEIDNVTSFDIIEKNDIYCLMSISGNSHTWNIVIDNVEVKYTNNFPIFNALGLTNKDLDIINNKANNETIAYLSSPAYHKTLNIIKKDWESTDNFHKEYQKYYKIFYDMIFNEYIAAKNNNKLDETQIDTYQKRLKTLY